MCPAENGAECLRNLDYPGDGEGRRMGEEVADDARTDVQVPCCGFFARTECPEALLGLSVEGEAEDMAGKSQPDIKPPLFKSREMPKGDVVEAEKVADSPRQLGDAEVPGKGDVEVPPPHIRLMEALSCTEEQLNAAIAKASGDKVKGWHELNDKQKEKLAANPDKLQPFIG